MTPREIAFDVIGRAILAREISPPPGLAGDETKLAAGVAIHRNNVRAAYLRVLQSAFPIVIRLVGEDFFRFAAHEYFHAHPPRSPLVARYGDDFPGFLATFEPARDFAYLPDVARIEIEHLKSWHAAEAVSPPAEDVLELLRRASDDAHVHLHPSLRLLSASHSAHTIWTHNRADETGALTLSGEVERVLIVRPERDVQSCVLAPAPYAVLEHLARGEPWRRALRAGLALSPPAVGPALLSEIASHRAIAGVSDAP
jgi:hypothetical protein